MEVQNGLKPPVGKLLNFNWSCRAVYTLTFHWSFLQDIYFWVRILPDPLILGSAACAWTTQLLQLGWCTIFLSNSIYRKWRIQIKVPLQFIYYKEIFPSFDLIPKIQHSLCSKLFNLNNITSTHGPRVRFRSAMNVGEWASSWLCIRRHLRGPKGAGAVSRGGWMGWYTLLVVVVVLLLLLLLLLLLMMFFFEWTLKRWWSIIVKLKIFALW